jgi:hypothetical protein
LIIRKVRSGFLAARGEATTAGAAAAGAEALGLSTAGALGDPAFGDLAIGDDKNKLQKIDQREQVNGSFETEVSKEQSES